MTHHDTDPHTTTRPDMARLARRWRALPLALMLAAGGIAAAQAAADPDAAPGRPHMHGGDHARHHGPHAGRGMARMLDDVGASEAQKAQIQQITEAARAEAVAGRDAGMALREQMRQLMAQPTIDAGAVEALRQQMLAQHDAASQRRVQTMLDVAQVLTPDQRVQLAERMAERKQAWAERMKARQEARERRAP